MIVQLLLAVLGIGGMYAALSHRPVLRYLAPFIGLLAQPLWMYFSVTTEAWGMFALSLMYAAVYVNSIRINMKGPI